MDDHTLRTLHRAMFMILITILHFSDLICSRRALNLAMSCLQCSNSAKGPVSSASFLIWSLSAKICTTKQSSCQVKGYIPVSFIYSHDELQANFPGYFSLDLLILTDQSESGFHNTKNKIFQHVLKWTLSVK